MLNLIINNHLNTLLGFRYIMHTAKSLKITDFAEACNAAADILHYEVCFHSEPFPTVRVNKYGELDEEWHPGWFLELLTTHTEQEAIEIIVSSKIEHALRPIPHIVFCNGPIPAEPIDDDDDLPF